MGIIKGHLRKNKKGNVSYVVPHNRKEVVKPQPIHLVHGIQLTQNQMDSVTGYMMSNKKKFISKEDLKKFLGRG